MGVEKSTPNFFALFMKAGTGKTYTSLAIMDKHIGNKDKRILVICPLAVINEWNESILKWCSKNTFLVINQDKYRNFKNLEYWDMIIIDEAHNFKNVKSKQYKVIQKTKRDYTLILTGTPTDGDSLHLLALSQLLSPKIIGSYWPCLKRDFITDEYGTILYSKPNVYNKYLELFKPYMYTLEAIDNQAMNSITINTTKVMIPLLKKQQYIYDKLEKEDVILMKAGDWRPPHSGAVKRAKLRGICSGFYTDNVDNLRTFKSSKEQVIISIIKQKVTNGDKLIIFINFTHEANTLEKICMDLDVDYMILTGKSKNTEAYIKEIKEFNYDILIVNYKSGGVGLTLTKCHEIVMYSLPESYISYEQAIKRCYRIGQLKDVNLNILICKSTIEDKKVMKSIEKKSVFCSKLFDI